MNRAAVTRTPGRSWTRRSPRIEPAKPLKPPRDWMRIVRRGILAVLLLILVGSIYFVFHAGKGKFSLAELLGSATEVAFGHGAAIAGESSGRTNILVYGMTEDGLRTDSIILVSYYWQQKKIVTLNIPRDLYVYDGYENDKMGEVYAYALSREPKNTSYPDNYVASVISKEYNIPINYWVQFDMVGEVNFINALGGININVPVSFTDCEYPTWNYSGYVRPCPSFSEGEQHMNGATALIYSRSRHSLDNDQGSDFARSKRQEQVIEAVMERLKALGVVGNLTQVSHYLSILGSTVTTDMTTSQIVSFASTLKNLNPQTQYVKAAWETGNGFLCDSSTSSGEYITLYGGDEPCTLGVSGIGAGGYQKSEARSLAIYYVQHLLTSGAQSQQAFLTTAETP